MIRSLLFVPADSERKLQKSLTSEADALIFDLEDSVAPGNKEAARVCLAGFLRELATSESTTPSTKRYFVRVNALDTGETLKDLAAVMPFAPFAICLPKCQDGGDVRTLGHYLSAFEAAHGLAHEQTRIFPVATETGPSIFGLGDYAPGDARLWGLMWGGEDLMADIGAMANHDSAGAWTQPFVLARNLCLFAAAKAGVLAIDTVSAAIDDAADLELECTNAQRDGFRGKVAIHPKQVAIINRIFAPSAASIDWANRVVKAMADAGGGVAKLDGKMLDAPHLRTARRILGTGK